jgi:phage terminase small subunit|tara:strand:+ start:5715 stop:6122 length:408 start_codon:yes stop_codon:yes gene_type:complete
MSLNAKQEKFSQAYVLHRNATEAAKAAGYSDKSANNQGYRLLQMNEVVERIADLENELVTDIDVVDELESQYAFAATNGHTNSAIKALELLSRVRGAKSDRTTHLSTETIEHEIVGYMEALGKDKIDELIKKCKF